MRVALVALALAVFLGVAGVVAGIYWDSLEPWLTGHPQLAEWAVALGTGGLALATLVLALQARREGSQVARQVDLQARQLEAGQQPAIYPITPHPWLETKGDDGRWLAFRNGGTGIARNVRGHLWWHDDGEATLRGQTLGPGDHFRVWLGDGKRIGRFFGAEGYVIYEDASGEEWQSRFRYEHDGSHIWALLLAWDKTSEQGDPAQDYPSETWAKEEIPDLPEPGVHWRIDLSSRTAPWPSSES